MFFNFNFETCQAFEEQDYIDIKNEKVYELPETNHNSPGSIKSQSFDLDASLDISFEEQAQVGHSQSIWSASVIFLTTTLISIIDSAKGFNSSEIYKYMSGPAFNEDQKNLEETIRKNKLLKAKQRSKFIEDLSKETELCELLKQLLKIYDQKIFQELVLVIHTIWQKKYLPFRQNKKNKQSFLPRFNCFRGFEDEQFNAQGSESFFQESNISQIKVAAEEHIELLVKEVFYQKKLKYLNLKEVKADKKDKEIILEAFTKFVKSISVAVFLSCEGVYEAESEMQPEIEGDEVSDFEMQENSNRFIRTFSQIQEDDDDCFIRTVSKKRKLE